MAESSPVNFFRLDHDGLARLFGELEAQIMNAVWQLENATVQEVCDHLGDVNYKTIMTVMNRLVQKRTLIRHRRGRAFVYRPAADRDTFLSGICRCVARGLLEDFGELALAAIVETANEIDPTLLDELEALIQEKRAETNGESQS